MKVTPHVAQNTNGRSSAIDGRTTRHGGYAVSQRIRKRIEEAFGWIKVVAGQEKTKFRGRDRVGWSFANTARERLTLIRLFEELRALGYEGGMTPSGATPRVGCASTPARRRTLMSR
jgi:hypothetical protein